MDSTPTPVPAPAVPLSAALRAGRQLIDPIRSNYFRPRAAGDPAARPGGCAIIVAAVGAGLLTLQSSAVSAQQWLVGPPTDDQRVPEFQTILYARAVRRAITATWPDAADRWAALDPLLAGQTWRTTAAPDQALGAMLEAVWETLNWSMDHIIASLEAIGA